MQIATCQALEGPTWKTPAIPCHFGQFFTPIITRSLSCDFNNTCTHGCCL